MASLYKPRKSTYQLPDGRYRTPDGSRVTKNTPGAVKVDLGPSEIWFGKYKTADGTMRRVKLCTDKTAAKQMLAKLVTDARLGTVGLADTFAPFRKIPLSMHLDAFQAHMEANNRNPEHVAQTISQCKAIFEGTGARTMGELDANKVESWLKELRDKRSISTSNHYLTAVKSFTKWMTKSRPPRSPHDPLACLAKLNAEGDIRRERRAMSHEEVLCLLQTTKASKKKFRGLMGEDRHFLYATALQTGYRSGELACLTSSCFDLNASPAVAVLDGAFTKNGKEARQPLPAELAEALRGFLSRKEPRKPIWPGTWHKVAFKMMAKDLAVGRAAWLEEAEEGTTERKRREESNFLVYRDADGLSVDFHATRHTYITHLAQGGVHPKVAQTLARHGNINLTMNRYTHFRPLRRSSRGRGG